MGSLSQNEQRKLAYFHALGKAMSENTQEVYESKYKSSHNVRLNEIWSDDIAYAPDFLTAFAESLVNSAVTFFSGMTLSQIGGSNGQAYAYISGGTFIRPLISPVDIPHPQTNLPSVGYQFSLYRGDGTPITITEGAWAVDYYAGIIHFAQGYTPADLGWGAIKGSFFQYSGNYGASGSTSGAFTTAYFNSGTSQIIFNSGLSTETIIDLSSLNNNSGFTNVIFNDTTNILTFNSGGTNEQSVNLSSLMDISGYTTAIFNSGNNQMIFNQGGINETIVDLSLLYNNSGFTTAVFNSATTEIVFNLGGVNEQHLDLSFLHDTSGFTSVEFNSGNSELVFNSGGTNEQIIDLSQLSSSGFTSVDFNSGNNYLIFNSGLSTETYVDLSPLKTLSGTTSLLSDSNIDMDANTTSYSSRLACSTPISSNSIENSNISVFVNGVQATVGNGVKTKDCYFSADGGTTAKSFNSIVVGDLLYWSYDGSNNPISGYELNAATDKLTFMYLTL
jgi:hypothetical protein